MTYGYKTLDDGTMVPYPIDTQLPYTKRITICMPCYGRPQKTVKAINCILNQDINNWEALIIGDNCKDFQQLINSGYLENIKQSQLLNNNIINYTNLDIHYGYWGYYIRNYCIQNALGRYIIWLDNDDTIDSNHMRHYLSEIEMSNYDLVYYNSKLIFSSNNQYIRDTHLSLGNIGNCDIIVKTDTARLVAGYDKTYSHDFNFISQIANIGYIKKSISINSTYNVHLHF